MSDGVNPDFVYAVTLLLLLWRPQGLFGRV
jgi:branched-subunit amino acid ABC-type transport system permease component